MKTKLQKNKNNQLHLLRRANIYFNCSICFSVTKRKKRTVIRQWSHPVQKKKKTNLKYKNGSTRYWLVTLQEKGNKVAEIWHSLAISKPIRMPLND